jgi:hypothetical protein
VLCPGPASDQPNQRPREGCEVDSASEEGEESEDEGLEGYRKGGERSKSLQSILSLKYL